MRGLILAALAADLAVLVYLNALPHPFVYDDLGSIVRNPALVDGAGPLEVIRQNVFRPVVSLSFALDHALWGFRPVGYHLTSVLLHALNVALLFVLGHGKMPARPGRAPNRAIVVVRTSQTFALPGTCARSKSSSVRTPSRCSASLASSKLWASITTTSTLPTKCLLPFTSRTG